MLWKLGSAEYWRSEGEGLQYTNQLEERRKKHIIYVRAKYEDDPIHLSRSLVSTILPVERWMGSTKTL